MNRKLYFSAAVLLFILSAFLICADTAADNGSLWNDREKAVAQSDITGFGILYRIPGLWNGPVTSDTPAGNYPVWYVDFRPVSASQISEFSTVDSSLCNYISFFIVKHDNRLKVAMRTDARFMDKGCITYEVMQEADENKGYYKFADFQSGDKRAYTVFEFKKDSFVMKVFTNKFNKLNKTVPHSTWKAKRIIMETAADAINHFKYPRPVMVRDFSDVFGDAHESVFFDIEKAPYRTENEPYVGKINFNITVDEKLKTTAKDELFLMLTTKPIFEGLKYDPDRLNYISRFVYIPVSMKKFTMTHVHPGTYYLYSYDDINGDKKHKRGDYMSSRLEHIITVKPESSIDVDTHIDFVIP